MILGKVEGRFINSSGWPLRLKAVGVLGSGFIYIIVHTVVPVHERCGWPSSRILYATRARPCSLVDAACCSAY